MSKNPGWKTKQIREALKKRYAAPAWALLEEVNQGTGGNCGRAADALAMSLWPSRGLTIHGFEIKASRSDWLKELSDPSKAEAVQRYCDYWWIVVGKSDIVKASELPETWGLLVPSGTGLKVNVDAPKAAKVDAVDRRFLASLLRRASELPGQAIAEARSAAWTDGAKYERENNAEDVRRIKERVSRFEEASGVVVDDWNHEKVGEAVRFVLEGKHLSLEKVLQGIKQRAMRVIESVDEELK